jgi:raffinose/stachyose/melibiose transport system permease protein
MKKTKSKAECIDFIRFVGPIFVLYFLFFLLPLCKTIRYSLTDWNGISRNISFIGFDNYINVFKDELFYSSMKFTFLSAIIYTIIANVGGFIFALILNRNIKSRNILRAILFCPFIFNNVTVGFIWQFILGRLLTDLYAATGLGIFKMGWLSNSNLVLYSVIFVKLWQSIGYFMVIYLAALQMLPESPIESALIDGCNTFQKIYYIIIPLLKPTFIATFFIGISETLNMFPLLMTLTNGGPGHSSESITLYIYREAFKSYRMGSSSALAVILAIIVLAIAILQMKLTKEDSQ